MVCGLTGHTAPKGASEPFPVQAQASGVKETTDYSNFAKTN